MSLNLLGGCDPAEHAVQSSRARVEVQWLDWYSYTWRNRRLPSSPQINLSVCLWVCHIRFNYSAENRLGPTNLVKYSLKIVDWHESWVSIFRNGFVVMAENRPGPTDLVKYSLNNVNWRESRVRYVWEYLWEFSKSTEKWQMGTMWHITLNTLFN